jgi:hypothetical protein
VIPAAASLLSQQGRRESVIPDCMGGLRLKVEILLFVGSEDGDDRGVDPWFWRAAGGRRNVPVWIEFRHGWRRGGGYEPGGRD